MSKKLILFTIDFPFAGGEPFLINEIPFLSKEFDEVLILPSRKISDESVSLPSNVKVHLDLVPINKEVNFNVILANFWLFFSIYMSNFFLTTKKKKYIKYRKSLLGYLWMDLSKYRTLQKFIKRNKIEQALFYDYWSMNSTLTLALLKKRGIIDQTVCRAHGFDVYSERYMEQVIPFREFKYKYVNKVFAVSNHVKATIYDNVSSKNHSKIQLSYLGVRNFGEEHVILKQHSEKRVIVSCANLIPLKRNDLIVDLLKGIPEDINIEWIHFGDGPEMEVFKKLIGTLPFNIKVIIKGRCLNSDVLNYYKNNFVDVFISFSESEGLPVSMMEAQSFGIPIMACDVNGIPEIVNKKTGVLLPIKFEIEDARGKLLEMFNTTYDRLNIHHHFNEKFNREQNYEKFGVLLSKLK